MAAYLERPRREFQLPTWRLSVKEYIPAFTRDEQLRKKRKEHVGTHATVLFMQAEGARVGLRTIDELRDSPRSLEEWALLQSGMMLGSAYHLFQWNGTPLTHRKLRLAELATDEGEFVDPTEFNQRTRQLQEAVIEETERVATNERNRGRISREAYSSLGHKVGAAATHVAVLPVRFYTQSDNPVDVQQGAFDATYSAWSGALRAHVNGEVNRLPSIAQLADADSTLRRYIRDPKSGVSDEVSEAVERAANPES